MSETISDSTSHETVRKTNIGEEEQFEVELILSHKVESRKKHRVFLVHWKGYDDPGDDTWEPESNLHLAKELLTQYLLDNDLPLKFNYEEHKKSSANKTDKKPRSSSRKPTKRTASTDKGEGNQMEMLEDSDGDEGYTLRDTRGKKVKASAIQSKNKWGKQKGQLAKSVDNREQIMKGLTPGWLSDSDYINEGESDNEIGKNESDSNQSERTPQDQLERTYTEETLSGHLDMLGHGDNLDLDNLLALEGNPPVKQKATKEISKGRTTGQRGRKEKKTDKPSNSSNVDHNYDAIITASGRPVRIYKREKKTTNVFEFADAIHDVNQKYTFLGLYRSPGDNEIYFHVRTNDDLDEFDVIFDDAIDMDARGVAKFLAGLFGISSGYAIIVKSPFQME